MKISEEAFFVVVVVVTGPALNEPESDPKDESLSFGQLCHALQVFVLRIHLGGVLERRER